jgi:succinate-semialdehyde dehydrogenase/glutarate-semialdehyde dehydrogenase
MLDSINPTTGELIKTYEAYTPEQVKSSLNLAHQCYLNWREAPMKDRSALFKRAAIVLLRRKEEYARLMAKEMGKLLTEGMAEIEKCSWACEYFADESAQLLEDIEIKTEYDHSFVTFQPLGVILGIMPWNFPFWQAFRFAAPALMAGNTCLIKHASNVSGCALAIESIFIEAGFPSGCCQTILLPSSQISDLVKNPSIKAVSLTGSSEAGKSVAALAGASLKKTVLELGGSDPYIVLQDAFLDEAVSICSKSRLNNAGQSCIAAKRFIVEEAIAQPFTEKLVAQFQREIMGDPFDPRTTLGPLARADLRAHLHHQVMRSIELGAECVLGGKIPSTSGSFYPATILANVQKGMPAYEEELFGPVASILVAKDQADAIALANDTAFGLGGVIFTQNLKKGAEIARSQIEAGSVFVNNLVRSDPRLPFGGIKNSGYGRELSLFGLREFVNVKTVCY